MGLSFTVPFPCQYPNGAVQINEIDELKCPLNIELAVPAGAGGVCESRLVGAGSCAISISAKKWNETHVMKIVHQDTGKYDLTSAENEMKMYLKTYEFSTSQLWSHILLPVVNVINFTYLLYI